MSPALSQLIIMRRERASVTAQLRRSNRNIPGVPVLPDVIATEYLPINCCPISSGLSTNVRTSVKVTSRSATQSSKCLINSCLLTTGSAV